MTYLNKILKTIPILAVSAFLYSLIMRDMVAMYIHPRFTMLTLITALGLFLVGVSFLRPDRKRLHEHATPWAILLVVALPVVLGWMVPPRPLGASAMENREVNYATLSSNAVSRATTQEFSSGEKTILDWLSQFGTGPAASFNGEEATLVGFVYYDDLFESDTFMVSRFIVSCCTADGSPVGLIVRYEGSDQLPLDQWVEISGTFEAQDFNGTDIPILQVTELKEIEPPRQPYLYP